MAARWRWWAPSASGSDRRARHGVELQEANRRIRERNEFGHEHEPELVAGATKEGRRLFFWIFLYGYAIFGAIATVDNRGKQLLPRIGHRARERRPGAPRGGRAGRLGRPVGR